MARNVLGSEKPLIQHISSCVNSPASVASAADLEELSTKNRITKSGVSYWVYLVAVDGVSAALPKSQQAIGASLRLPPSIVQSRSAAVLSVTWGVAVAWRYAGQQVSQAAARETLGIAATELIAQTHGWRPDRDTPRMYFRDIEEIVSIVKQSIYILPVQFVQGWIVPGFVSL